MKLQVLHSTVKNCLYAQLETCIGFFNTSALPHLSLGNVYDFMIVGHSNSLNKQTGFPSTVFLDLVRPTDVLVTAPVLERAMCVGTEGVVELISTYDDELGEIYQGRSISVPYVDNFNIGDLPKCPTPDISFWVRNIHGTNYAAGVDRYEDISPIFLKQHSIEDVMNCRAEITRMKEIYGNSKYIDGVSLHSALNRLLAKYNLNKSQFGG